MIILNGFAVGAMISAAAAFYSAEYREGRAMAAISVALFMAWECWK